MSTVILTAYMFVWPTQNITFKTKAANWDDAYTAAVQYCIKKMPENTDSITTIDICANPKQINKDN